MFMWGNDNRFIQAGNQFAAMDQVLAALRDMAQSTGCGACCSPCEFL
jgi:bacterioferritin-associated ferredoxin